MEEKHQPDSMATITMKPEYPPSEVYSTSEPPPAYRQRVSSSVQIARIAALTVVASAFILGAFILASSWVAAHASCHQLEQLDAMLDKELALEGRAYGNDGLLADEPLPIGNAHALHAAPPPAPSSSAAPPPSPSQPELVAQVKEDALSRAESKINEDRLQKIDDDKSDSHNGSDESSESDSSAEDEDDLDAVRPFKLPVHFDLDDLAGAFLANNQKGRMNCVVERRREEPERRFPFSILGAFAPRQAQAERIAIICHGGDEQRPMIPEPQSQVFAFPLTGPVRLPLRPQPERPAPAAEPRMPPFGGPMGPMGPMGHMEPMGPMPQRHNAPFPLSLPWDSSEEQMNAPREMRIHVQRVIAIPAPHNMPPAPQNMPPPPENMGPFAPPPPPPQNNDQNEQPTVLHQFVPQSAPTQELEQPEVQKMQMEGSPVQMNLPWGLTPEDLRAITRTAEEASQQRNQPDNDMQEMKTIVNSLAAAAQAEAEAEARAEAEAHAEADTQQEDHQQDALPQDALPLNLAAPRVPRTMMLPQEMDARPHYMQPRSVHSADAPTLERFRRDVVQSSKRVKRCACDCI